MNALSCSIYRPLSGRIIIDSEQVSAIFEIFNNVVSNNIELALEEDKRYLEKRVGRPDFEIDLSDGSSYKEKNVDIIQKIETGPNRLISAISITVPTGNISCSLKLHVRGGAILHNIFTISGPEDQVQHIATAVERVIRRRRDITTFLDKIPIIVLSWSIALLGFLRPTFDLMWGRSVSDKTGLVFLYIAVSFFVGVVLSIFLDGIKVRYLPKTAFLWGENYERYKIGKRLCEVIAYGIPIWFVGNFAAIYFFS